MYFDKQMFLEADREYATVCPSLEFLTSCSEMGCDGSVAEWSKALVLGTSLFGGVGSNPTAAKYSVLSQQQHLPMYGYLPHHVVY